MAEQPTISTHLLDAQSGQPAAGIPVRLTNLDADEQVGQAITDGDGRIRRLLEGPLTVGRYRLTVSLNGAFFEEVAITFVVDDASRSWHVPLLLAPYSLTTYRGS
ncbi:MAG: 5-hydroxyisourate hydrolase [Chloroflexota bacterium]|jgi:5-hydroxyisourate hydrolase|nr:5-hydroxyisourate hydrolase [Chloroflexota bacterium]